MKYEVNIIDKPFIKDKIEYERTAEVILYKEDGTIDKRIERGYVKIPEIEQQIEIGNDINLDYCFIENLDLHGCKIKLFTARNAFFAGVAYFREAHFSERADFRYAQFNGEANFLETQFRGEACFNRAEFNGEAHFFGTEFRGEATFFGTEFKGEATFIGTQFSGEAFFPDAQFRGEATFSDALFSGKATFIKAEFNGEADFSSANFLDHVLFMNSICKVFILDNCIIEKTFDLNNTKFKELSLNNLKILGYIYLEWNNNIRNSIHKYVQRDDKEKEVVSLTPYWDKAKQYRLLKENFNKIGQYDDEDKAYVEFKRNEALSKIYDGENKSNMLHKIIKLVVYGLKWLVEDGIGVYATSPIRIFTSLVISIVIFGMAYCFCGVGKGYFGICILQNVKAALYYSAITAFTVGYGDLNPAHNELVALLSSIEAFLGVFLMAYFIVAFSRKVLR